MGQAYIEYDPETQYFCGVCQTAQAYGHLCAMPGTAPQPIEENTSGVCDYCEFVIPARYKECPRCRDRFAMAALPHVIQLRIAAAGAGQCVLTPQGIAEDADIQADALLAARKPKP